MLCALYRHDFILRVEALDTGEGEPLQIVQDVLLEVIIEGSQTALIVITLAIAIFNLYQPRNERTILKVNLCQPRNGSSK